MSIRHEKRRFVEKVDFLTSPGWFCGHDQRNESRLSEGGTFRAITNLAVLGFDDGSKRMSVRALNPGVTKKDVQNHTGFELLFDSNVLETKAPTAEELRLLRSLDPDRILLS